jgi:hypothetical protein
MGAEWRSLFLVCEIDETEIKDIEFEKRISAIEARSQQQIKSWQPLRVIQYIALGLILFLVMVGVIQFVSAG